tara:strand:+ start:181 stop:510 length:330 start_codon:yes stop_codon:yes gene_type:complete
MKYVDPNVDKMPAENQTTSKIYGRHGDEVLSKKEKDMAKAIQRSSSTSYHIQTYEGAPYDPNGMYSHREDNIELKYKKVSKDTFDFYMLFLTTKNSLYLTRSQRSFLND